ncbi:MAG TPA: ATP-binding cassette domain-containing protein, partial [Solirubrobacteraceae bacterium]|nr:ATP-binding cassette domain-containing protein [Solirubrobacteraceae bacterium]
MLAPTSPYLSASRREAIGFLDQRADHNLVPALPVGEGIVLALALRGVGRSERRARARALLEAVGLADRARSLPAACSGGERQRLALCAALAHRPRLLLADEPTGELDAESARGVRALIAELARAEGATVVVVSHDPAMAAVADRAVRLRDGRIGGERRDGAETLVVDDRGWVRLPPALLAAAGIGDRASAHAGPGEVAVRPAGPPPPPVPTAAAAAPALGAGPATRVECRAVSKAFGARTVFAALSTAFAPGRLTVVTGRSGSGKTTLLR